MISIRYRRAILPVASTHPDPTLRFLLALRMGQLVPADDDPSVRFIVFEAGDTIDALGADLAYVFTDDGDGAMPMPSSTSIGPTATAMVCFCCRMAGGGRPRPVGDRTFFFDRR